MPYHLCGSQAVLSAAVTTAVAFGFGGKSKRVTSSSGSCFKVVAAFGYSAGDILPRNARVKTLTAERLKTA